MTAAVTPLLASVPDVDPEKLPWLQFWVNDWRSDQGLRVCSIGARGLWIEMLCLMHHCEPYGTLSDEEGAPMASASLGVLVGMTVTDVDVLVKELEKKKIFSRDVAGRIYSRRMQRDHHIRKIRSAAGKKGGKRTAKKRSKG